MTLQMHDERHPEHQVNNSFQLRKVCYAQFMARLEDHLSTRERGCFDGHFLLAMPGMEDERFHRSVIFVCAHSGDGAMGFIVNRPQHLQFEHLMRKLQFEKPELNLVEPEAGQLIDFPVLSGGPVDTGRGFVLHTDDYQSQSTMPVNDDLCLTATVDILQAIHRGQGPRRGIMLLGYAGWAAGQLEAEMAANSWLSCPADDNLVFDTETGDKYDRVLKLMGVAPGMLSMEAGHA